MQTSQTLVKELFGKPHQLVNAEGLQFTLLQSFTLLPVSELFLTATPVASDPDTDGNLLIDT